MIWSQEQTDVVKKMWADGRSATEIGIAVGKSRNSILGKLHREGVPKRSPQPNAPKAMRSGAASSKLSRKRMKRGSLSTHRVLDKQEAWAKLPKPVRAPPAAPTSATNVRLLDIGYGQCRYILGEVAGPSTIMCGAPVKDSCGSWCAFHSKVVYQPPSSRHGAASLAPA